MSSAFPFAAVLWDIDGTLADSEPLHIASFQRLCARIGLELPGNFHDLTVGKSEERTHAWMRDTLGLTMDFDAWTRARFADYLDHVAQIPVFEHSLALWHRLEAMGVKQALVSNSDRIIVSANIERLGLQAPGLISLSRNDVVNGKPDAEPYLRAATLLGVDPGECAVIEDSVTGMTAGLSAGAQVFGLPHAIGRVPDAVRPLAELSEILAETV